MELLKDFFEQVPMAALFLSLAIGCGIGKIKIGQFRLGGLTGSLLAAVVIGQIGVPVDPVVKQMMFALFIFATGYVCGPQFVASLNRKTLKLLHLAIFSGIVVFATIWGLSQVLDLDKGTAAGLLAGATTESASIGTAAEGLRRLGLEAEEIRKLESNIGVAYALTYLFGMTVVMFFCSRVAQVFYGRYVLKLNPVVLCGALAGNLTMTPALNMVIEQAESGTPVMGYTVSYAVSNVFLTFLGPIIVFAV